MNKTEVIELAKKLTGSTDINVLIKEATALEEYFGAKYGTKMSSVEVTPADFPELYKFKLVLGSYNQIVNIEANAIQKQILDLVNDTTSRFLYCPNSNGISIALAWLALNIVERHEGKRVVLFSPNWSALRKNITLLNNNGFKMLEPNGPDCAEYVSNRTNSRLFFMSYKQIDLSVEPNMIIMDSVDTIPFSHKVIADKIEAYARLNDAQFIPYASKIIDGGPIANDLWNSSLLGKPLLL